MTTFLGNGKNYPSNCFFISWMFLALSSSALSQIHQSRDSSQPAASAKGLQTGDLRETLASPSFLADLEFRVLGEDVGYDLENELVHAFQIDSKNPKFPYLLSILYQKMQTKDNEDRDYYLSRAAFLARQAYELDKKSAYGYVALANLLFLASQREKALSLLQRVRLSLRESELWLLDYHEAIFLNEMDRPEEALVKIAELFENKDRQIRYLATELCQSTCLKLETDILMPLLKKWHKETKSVKIAAILAKNLIRTGQNMKAREILIQSANENPISHEAKIELAENYLSEAPLLPERALYFIKKHLKIAAAKETTANETTAMENGQSQVPIEKSHSKNKLKTESNFAIPKEIDFLDRTQLIPQNQRIAFLKILGKASLRTGLVREAEMAFLSYLGQNHNKLAAKEIIALYIGLNKSKAGIELIDKFIDQKPGEANLHALRGDLSQQDKLNLESAAEDYLDAITLRPEDTTFYNSLGLIYFKMNRLEHAIQVFEKSVLLNPKDSGAFYHLACAQALSGKDELAINSLEKAINMSPERSLDALKDKYFDSFKSSLRFQTLIESAISH